MSKFLGKLDTPSMDSESWFPLPWSLKSTLTHRSGDDFSAGRRLLERNVTEMMCPYKSITNFTFACRIKIEFLVSQIKDFMSFCSFWCTAECLVVTIFCQRYRLLLSKQHNTSANAVHKINCKQKVMMRLKKKQNTFSWFSKQDTTAQQLYYLPFHLYPLQLTVLLQF